MPPTFARAAFVVSLALILSCSSSESPAPSPPLPSIPCSSAAIAASMEAFAIADVSVGIDTGGDPGLAIVRLDLRRYLSELWGSPVDVADGAPDSARRATVWLSLSPEARAQAGFKGTTGYALKRVAGGAGPRFVVTANDARDLAYGAYALLEALGARFFHPKEELVPHFEGPRLPAALDVTRAPAFASRGIHLHTLHPIEYFAAFNQPSPANLADARLFVDWLVKSGQNHLQWVLLGDVDFEAFRPHAQAIVAYAHQRGVAVGAVVQLWGGSALQNNFVLVSDEKKANAQLDSQLDKLLTVPWDVIELQLGEFLASDPQSVIDWLDHAVTHVAATQPSVEVNVVNHVGNYPKLYVQYQGETVFFYHLPQFADSRLGQTVHTLSFFDLYRDWATYAHPDFHLQHDYLLKELPTRRVKYNPESAYWIGSDNDVPLFLPEYLYSRWNDVHRLTAEVAEKGLPPVGGHVLFSSGHEWGYWLTDWLTARMLWRPDAPLEELLADYSAGYGSCSGEIATVMSKSIDIQTRYLFDARLAAYVQGENSTIDLAYLAGFETHPKRIAYEDVLAMAAPERDAFEKAIVGGLEAMARELQPLEDAVAARCRGADEAIAPWCDELWDGLAVDRLRADHAAHLYRAVLARARGANPEAEYSAAATRTAEAAAVIARREAHYRFDAHLLDDAYGNPTSYAFGYLRQAHTQCYWHREEKQVRALLDTGAPLGVFGLPTCQN